jgi:hypothetical protein
MEAHLVEGLPIVPDVLVCRMHRCLEPLELGGAQLVDRHGRDLVVGQRGAAGGRG